MVMVRIKREDFLSRLQAIEGGLAQREIQEQSTCACFKQGWLLSFNDLVCCRVASKLGKEFTGAVKAKPLIAYLSKLPDDEVSLETTEKELRITAGTRSSGIAMQPEVQLAVEQVETPGAWRVLPTDFEDAVTVVTQCASSDDSDFKLTCVHLAADRLEACDGMQLAYFPIDTGLEQDTYIRRDSIRHILHKNMVEVSETASWLHFRNDRKLVISLRKFSVSDYPDLSPIMAMEGGAPATLPKGAVDSADLASIFSRENVDNDHIRVELRPGEMRIKGRGISGWFEEPRPMKYDGEEIAFIITPKLLSDIVEKYQEVMISKNKLKVEGKYTFVAYLGPVDEPADAGIPEEEPVGAAVGDEDDGLAPSPDGEDIPY